MYNTTQFVEYVKKLSKSKLKSLNFLNHLNNKHDILYPSQDKIAVYAKCSREWISKKTTDLHDDHILTKAFRYKNTSLYVLHPLFKDFWVRQQLKHLIPSLAWIPLSIALLACAGMPTKSSQYIYKELLVSSCFDLFVKKNMNYFGNGGNFCYSIPEGEYRKLDTSKKEGVVMKSDTEKLHERLESWLGLDNPSAILRLKSYDDKLLLEAERLLKKAIQTKSIDNPTGYFFKTLQAISLQKQTNKTSDNSTTTDRTSNQPNQPVIVDYISTWKTKTPEELTELRNEVVQQSGSLATLIESFGMRSITNAYSTEPSVRKDRLNKEDWKRRNAKQKEYIRAIYGTEGQVISTPKQAKELGGFEALYGALLPFIKKPTNPEPKPVAKISTSATEFTTDDDQWFDLQQPMDIEDFDILQEKKKLI